jgi:GNAT superfamily N-acetyltransferase
VADVAVLAELRGIEGDKLEAYAGWVAAHADTHLPFVAEIDGYVVGVAWLLVAERVPGNALLERWYGDIQSVMVREQYRNRGIGGALIAAILAEARTRGLLHVTVHSGRRAVDFYLRNGFSQHRQLLLWEQPGDGGKQAALRASGGLHTSATTS